MPRDHHSISRIQAMVIKHVTEIDIRRIPGFNTDETGVTEIDFFIFLVHEGDSLFVGTIGSNFIEST